MNMNNEVIPVRGVSGIIKDDIESRNPYLICSWLGRGRKDALEHLCQLSENNNFQYYLQEGILKTNQILHIYEFLFLLSENKLKGFDQEELENRIIESKNAKLMQYCIGFVNLINLKRMKNALYDTKNITYIRELSEDEECAKRLGIDDDREAIREYKEALDRAINAEGEEAYFPESLKKFGDINTEIDALKDEILGKDDPYLVIELANWMDYLNKNKGTKYDLEDLDKKMIELSDPMGIYEYLASNESIKDRMALLEKLVQIDFKKYPEYVRDYAGQFLSEEEMDYLNNALEKND